MSQCWVQPRRKLAEGEWSSYRGSTSDPGRTIDIGTVITGVTAAGNTSSIGTLKCRELPRGILFRASGIAIPAHDDQSKIRMIGANARKNCLPPPRNMQGVGNSQRVTVMALGIVDGLILQISRILESVFDGIEYWSAKNASNRIAKQKMKAKPHLADSTLGLYQFEDEPRHRPRAGQQY